MSDDTERCQSRIVVDGTTAYTVLEPLDWIRERIEQDTWIELQSWIGSDLMPPHCMLLRTERITTVEELTEGDWVWSKHATEAHYARQLQQLDSHQKLPPPPRLSDVSLIGYRSSAKPPKRRSHP